MKVLFIGLSNKKDTKPFDVTTVSGKILAELCKKASIKEAEFINLIPYAPVDENGKLRYPTEDEISEALPGTLTRISNVGADLVFLLGGIVQKSLIQKVPGAVGIYHPAYIARSRGRFDNYLEVVTGAIENILQCESCDDIDTTDVVKYHFDGKSKFLCRCVHTG